jgi:galactokinase
MVVSASEKGKTRLRVIPRGFLVEVQQKVRRYQELRRIRARLVTIHREMLRVLDAMEAMRREELPCSDKKPSSKGE